MKNVSLFFLLSFLISSLFSKKEKVFILKKLINAQEETQVDICDPYFYIILESEEEGFLSPTIFLKKSHPGEESPSSILEKIIGLQIKIDEKTFAINSYEQKGEAIFFYSTKLKSPVIKMQKKPDY